MPGPPYIIQVILDGGAARYIFAETELRGGGVKCPLPRCTVVLLSRQAAAPAATMTD